MKFCSCAGDAVNKDSYWTHYRFNADQDHFVMGEVSLPSKLDPAADNYNREVLIHRVNIPDAWDEDLYPYKNDRLSVIISCITNGEEGHITYRF